MWVLLRGTSWGLSLVVLWLPQRWPLTATWRACGVAPTSASCLAKAQLTCCISSTARGVSDVCDRFRVEERSLLFNVKVEKPGQAADGEGRYCMVAWCKNWKPPWERHLRTTKRYKLHLLLCCCTGAPFFWLKILPLMHLFSNYWLKIYYMPRSCPKYWSEANKSLFEDV